MSVEPASPDTGGSSNIAPSFGDADKFAAEIGRLKPPGVDGGDVSARDAVGQRYAFNDQTMPGSGIKTDATPQVQEINPNKGPSFWSGLKGLSPLGVGSLAAYSAADRTARNSIATNYYAPDLALRVYREGSPGPNGEKAAFLRTSPDGKEEILPVDVKLNEDAWRHLGQPLQEIVSFDKKQLGQAYDLSRLTPESRQRLGLSPLATNAGSNPDEKPDQPAAPNELKEGGIYDLRNAEEAHEVETWRNQGMSPTQINQALENLRRSKGESATPTNELSGSSHGAGSSITEFNPPIVAQLGKIDESRSKLNAAEKKVAEWYGERGYDVTAIPREPDKKTPDFSLSKDGETFSTEAKVATTGRAETIISRATKGAKQDSHITIDVRAKETSRETIEEALTRLAGSDKLPAGSTVIVIGDGFALRLNK